MACGSGVTFHGFLAPALGLAALLFCSSAGALGTGRSPCGPEVPVCAEGLFLLSVSRPSVAFFALVFLCLNSEKQF